LALEQRVYRWLLNLLRVPCEGKEAPVDWHNAV
jgi:hypothetical protein